ncbi:helix-turn-helix domain-containing protein [Paenibacillus sp. DXFW5]|uniref:Helix-turn-helix domain-containing protein n=1 Tax=Paenibacillus rhizolycopersici TaxID=2780073 RepID=A0ABS2H6T8_9BACL|nr:RodZ family helix-turn-helix domain-containing protein [Paenibacillus sp. J53TS2]MBM6997137.1 helix-turn-helix domain-containing protein [Paenibacillus rhizolycopersici]GIP46596.1 XRE family transcriptional regulator [Paenibacillus sp. J53TS2]
MSELGQQLREARLARGLSLDDVQEMTKIRKRYLEAIEMGDYKVLPGSFYVRAFIKTYAETVGLDADELLAEHRQNVPSSAPEPTMEPVIQKRRSRQHNERNSKWLSTTLMWSFAVLILIVIYMYFSVWGNNKDEAEGNKEPDPTPVTQGKTPTNGNQNGTNAGNGTAGDAVGGNKGAGNGTDTVTDPGTNNGTNAGNMGNGGNETPGNEPGNQITVVPDGTEGSTTKYKIQNPGTQPVQVVITASGESWVEVRKGSKSGEKLYFGKTKDGDVLTYDVVPEGLYILSGNSAKTAIAVAEQPIEDGKTTSRFFLSLDDGTGGSTAGNTGTETDGTVTNNETTTGSE